MLKIKKGSDELGIYKHSCFCLIPSFGNCSIVNDDDMTIIVSRLYTIEWLWFGIVLHIKFK